MDFGPAGTLHDTSQFKVHVMYLYGAFKGSKIKNVHIFGLSTVHTFEPNIIFIRIILIMLSLLKYPVDSRAHQLSVTSEQMLIAKRNTIHKLYHN